MFHGELVVMKNIVVRGLRLANNEHCSFTDPTSRRRCSALQWNPDVATQLIVASDDDRSPSLQVPYLVATSPPFYQHVPLFLSIDNIHLVNFIFVLVRSFVLCFGM